MVLKLSADHHRLISHMDSPQIGHGASACPWTIDFCDLFKSRKIPGEPVRKAERIPAVQSCNFAHQEFDSYRSTIADALCKQ